jgi:hypothetical protein
MTFPAVALDLLTTAERCDLTNARPPAAWSAPLEEAKVLLGGLLTTNDAAAICEERG